MKSKIVLFASIFVTAFMLLTAAGVAYAMQGFNNPTVNPTPIALAQPMLQAGAAQQIANREAEYQKLIAEANQRIETLNNEVTTLQQQKAQPAASQQITVDQAVQIASTKVGESESLQSLPELVDYQGANAYEVSFTDGKVYVDAKNGAILYNGIVQPITSQRAGEIAGQYLGGMNPKYAAIRLVNFNGTPIYQVVFSGDKEYVVFIDMKGNVLKAQIYQYTGGGGGGGGGSSSGGNGESHENSEREVD
jgi:uncharacterized membrane protein YkoI